MVTFYWLLIKKNEIKIFIGEKMITLSKSLGNICFLLQKLIEHLHLF